MTDVVTATSRNALAAMGSPQAGDAAFLSEAGREGIFVFRAADLSGEVTADPRQGLYVAPSADTDGSSGAWVREFEQLTPEYFGAVGDGATDDTDALTGFFEQIGGRDGCLGRTYAISAQVPVSGKTGFRIMGQGSIVAAGDMPVGSGTSVLQFDACSHFVLEGFTADGNRAEREMTQTSAFGIRIVGCHHGVLRRVSANNAVDGFYVASPDDPTEDQLPHDLLFDQCFADNNWRQGMSIIEGHRIIVRAGKYSHTQGSLDDGEGGPCAGIDIEPDDDPTWIQDRVRNILIDGVTFDGNKGFNLQISHKNGVHDIVVRDCFFLNNGKGAISVAAAGTKIIRPYLKGWDASAYTSHAATLSAAPKRGLIDIPAVATVGSVYIERPVFRAISGASSAQRLIYVHSAGYGSNRIVEPDVDASGFPVLYLRSANSVLTGGRIAGVTAADSLTVTGAGAVVEGTQFLACARNNIMSQGTRHTLRNVKAENATGTSGAVLRAINADAVIEGCSVHWDASTAGDGISCEAAPRRLCGNTVTNCAGTPYLIAGAPSEQDNDMANGVVLEHDSIALADGATITPNLILGRNFAVTLGGNRILANPANMRTGQRGTIRITQDGTGLRTLAYGTAWKFPGGAPTLSVAPGAVDVITYFVRDASKIEATIAKAFL